MRQYLMVAEGGEKIIRQERIKKFLMELQKDPLAEKSMLRLEPNPMITNNMDKGKGLVFDYGKKYEIVKGQKIMGDAIQLGQAMSRLPIHNESLFQGEVANFSGSSLSLQGFSMVIRSGFSEASPSGKTLKKKRSRRRPIKSQRCKEDTLATPSAETHKGVLIYKRKATVQAEVTSKVARRKKEVDPNEGPPNQY